MSRPVELHEASLRSVTVLVSQFNLKLGLARRAFPGFGSSPIGRLPKWYQRRDKAIFHAFNHSSLPACGLGFSHA